MKSTTHRGGIHALTFLHFLIVFNVQMLLNGKQSCYKTGDWKTLNLPNLVFRSRKLKNDQRKQFKYMYEYTIMVIARFLHNIILKHFKE